MLSLSIKSKMKNPYSVPIRHECCSELWNHSLPRFYWECHSKNFFYKTRDIWLAWGSWVTPFSSLLGGPVLTPLLACLGGLLVLLSHGWPLPALSDTGLHLCIRIAPSIQGEIRIFNGWVSFLSQKFLESISTQDKVSGPCPVWTQTSMQRDMNWNQEPSFQVNKRVNDADILYQVWSFSETLGFGLDWKLVCQNAAERCVSRSQNGVFLLGTTNSSDGAMEIQLHITWPYIRQIGGLPLPVCPEDLPSVRHCAKYSANIISFSPL